MLQKQHFVNHFPMVIAQGTDIPGYTASVPSRKGRPRRGEKRGLNYGKDPTMGHGTGYDFWMPPAECATCEALREKVVTAITRHYRLLSKLEIARISRETEAVTKLEPLVRSAWSERVEASEAYRAHVRSHARTAAQS